MPKVCVLRTDGTNCDTETARAFTLAGAEPETVHVNELASGSKKLEDYQVLALPGGFSYGDDVQSGKILAVELMSRLEDQLRRFVDGGKLIIGICNGFQVLVQTGLLPFRTLGEQQTTLAGNDVGHFECRWVRMEVSETPCVFTQGLPREIELPVAHGEGKLFAESETLARIEHERLVPLRYSDGMGQTMEYPANPNGSSHAIAGACSPSGRIFGLMPHPERFVEVTDHPNWRRGRVEPYGLRFFKNAVEEARQL